MIERELGAFHVRPHWGKLFTISPCGSSRQIRTLPEFVEICEKYDPHGKFHNDFLNTTFSAAKACRGCRRNGLCRPFRDPRLEPPRSLSH